MASKKQEATPEDIGARLSEQEAAPVAATTEAPVAAEPTPAFDISKLSVDQLQALKALLGATPDRPNTPRSNPIVKLRRIDGKIITAIGKCFMTLHTDDLTRITSEVLLIPVKFLGSDEFENVVWKDFMNADQVKCEVVSTRREPGRIVEGQVMSNETGRMIDMEVTTVTDYFTVKLPDGSDPATIELPADIFNA